MLKISQPYLVLFFCCFSLLSTFSLFAQETDVLMTNSRGIDKNRYQEIKGSPYLFEEWRKGKIISVDTDTIEGVLLNFNGKTKGFEIKKGNNFIELDSKWYTSVLVKNKEVDEYTVFQKNSLPPLTDEFTRVVYKGVNFSLMEHFISKIELKVINNVGKNEELRKFYSKKNYYLIKNEKATLLKLKKKNLFAFLGHKSELENFSKKEKIKLTKEADLVKLFTFYEESGFAQ